MNPQTTCSRKRDDARRGESSVRGIARHSAIGGPRHSPRLRALSSLSRDVVRLITDRSPSELHDANGEQRPSLWMTL